MAKADYGRRNKENRMKETNALRLDSQILTVRRKGREVVCAFPEGGRGRKENTLLPCKKKKTKKKRVLHQIKNSTRGVATVAEVDLKKGKLRAANGKLSKTRGTQRNLLSKKKKDGKASWGK